MEIYKKKWNISTKDKAQKIYKDIAEKKQFIMAFQGNALDKLKKMISLKKQIQTKKKRWKTKIR
jgi:hypothetical protein